ncbi:hypothetical protein CR513_33999, partial [Mucuna pruriens]
MSHTCEGSHTFHFSDLISLSSDLDSKRSNSFQKGEPDTDLDNIHKDIKKEQEARDNQTPKGLMTRGRLRKLQEVLQKVHLLRNLEDSGSSPSPTIYIIGYPPIQARSDHEEPYIRPPSFCKLII